MRVFNSTSENAAVLLLVAIFWRASIVPQPAGQLLAGIHRPQPASMSSGRPRESGDILSEERQHIWRELASVAPSSQQVG